jgi:hypothetical protein
MRFYIRQYVKMLDKSLVKVLIKMSNTSGLKPREMHHALKYEISDDDQFIVTMKQKGIEEQNHLIGNVEITTPCDPTNTNLSNCPVPRKDIKRLFKHPDFAVVVLKDSIEIIKKELISLTEKNQGVYYEVIERDKIADEEVTCLVVVFFEDHILD